MAWSFGDSFDLYAAYGDMVNGYWDSMTGSLTIGSGRFANSRAIYPAPNGFVTKSSGVNDAVHHLVFSLMQTGAVSGSSLPCYIELFDGATAQCTVMFRSDGAFVLQSGGPGGATLATYTGGVAAANVWYGFEIEIVINNTTGSFTVRKNGNSVNDFTATSLNTRGGTTNNYANQIRIGNSGVAFPQYFDDFFWQSGAATGNWLGDIRCYARMPASDQSVTFSKLSPIFAQNNASASNSGAQAANLIKACAVVCPASGTLASMTFNFNTAATGHAKLAFYDASGSGGGPGVLLATSAELTNPVAGVNVFPVTSGPSVVRGVTYYVALLTDVSITAQGTTGAGNFTQTLAATYPTFPANMVGFANGSFNVYPGMGSQGMNVTPTNFGSVNEPQQDGLTTYVYDSNPGDQDLYGIASIASTPLAVIATTVRAYMQKSDAGTRTAAVQLKSGATTVASPTLTLTTSGFQWAWRIDTVDPNTSAPWTPTAVNNAQIGPTVIA